MQMTNATLTDDGRWTPDPRDKWGQYTFEHVLGSFKPDIVWVTADFYMAPYLTDYARSYGFKLVWWGLSPGDPMNINDVPVIQGIDECIAMTQHAANQWQAHTGKRFGVIPLGVNKEFFHPLAGENVSKMRDFNTGGEVGDNDFFILWVGKNQDRKKPWLPLEVLHYLRSGEWGWIDDQPVLRYYDQTSRKYIGPTIDGINQPLPVPAYLWIHSEIRPGRWDLNLLAERFGLKPGEHVFRTKGLTEIAGLTNEHLGNLYQMADAVSMLSGSEGFGMPTLEAAACSVPAVCTNYGATGEVGRSLGAVMVPPVAYDIAPGVHYRIAQPSLPHAVEAFYRLYELKINKREEWLTRKTDLAKKTLENYDWDLIADHWLKVLREVAGRPKAVGMGTII